VLLGGGDPLNADDDECCRSPGVTDATAAGFTGRACGGGGHCCDVSSSYHCLRHIVAREEWQPALICRRCYFCVRALEIDAHTQKDGASHHSPPKQFIVCVFLHCVKAAEQLSSRTKGSRARAFAVEQDVVT